MKSPIHQMYCTHCTFGTSALERREGEIAERVLGYSARAASLDREELRKAYRQVERYLYYALPSDAPPEEKLRLDAALAPRRLVFFPSIGGLQVLGQVSYRQKDTSRNERVGSYFGHLLLGERAAGAWSVVDCLKLWGAPWVGEDSSKIPFDLPPLAKLDNLRTAPRPAIDDGVLTSFVSTAPGKPFDDPQHVIPARWNNVSRTERATLLADLLRAYLEFAAGRRENVLVVAEPSVAALLFYGVARLLPADKFRDEISFSTFEADPDRLPTALAATTFHDPETADLKPETYRRAGYVINTFRKKNSVNPLRSKGTYARLMVDKLAAEGAPAVDAILAAVAAAEPQKPEDLEALAETYALVPALLDSQRPMTDGRWRESTLARPFLRSLICGALAGEVAGSPRLKALAAGPNVMVLLDLMATNGDAEESPPVRALLRSLPPERFQDLLASDRIPVGQKADVLACFIHQTQHFPENCPQLWNGGGRGAKSPRDPAASSVPRLLSAVLARLDLNTLQQIQPQVSPAHSAAYLIGLVQAAKLDPAKQSLCVHVVTAMDDTQLARFLGAYGEELRPYYPKPERKLAKRLRRYLNDLPSRPAQVPERLPMLQAWSGFFEESAEIKERLSAWGMLVKDVTALKSYSTADEQDDDATPMWMKYDTIGKRIANSLQRAMPAESYGGHDHIAKKISCLRELGRAITGRDDFLPDVVWTAIREVFRGGFWNLNSVTAAANTIAVAEDWKATAAEEEKGPGFWAELKANPLLPIFGVMACVLVLVMVGLIAWLTMPADSGERPAEEHTPTATEIERDALMHEMQHPGTPQTQEPPREMNNPPPEQPYQEQPQEESPPEVRPRRRLPNGPQQSPQAPFRSPNRS